MNKSAYCVGCRTIKPLPMFYDFDRRGGSRHGLCKACKRKIDGNELRSVPQQIAANLAFVFKQIDEVRHGKRSR